MNLLRAMAALIFAPLLAAVAQTAAPTSELQFVSSDSRLQAAFDWAKPQALAYAHVAGSPLGAWYEAALPGREAFCMRDVAHQTTGAAALGLYDANRNMLQRFGAAVSVKRDWASYWEIDKNGNPSLADYVSDQDFWYNLPANFDMIDAAYRMWLWTGDDTYVQSAPMQNLLLHSAHEYVEAWSLYPETLLSRPRIMNRHLQDGKFVEARGIPSYTEEERDFSAGTDLIAAEYRAFADLRKIAEWQGHTVEANRYGEVAAKLSSLIEQNAWNSVGHHVAGSFSQKSGWQRSGDDLALYFEALENPTHIRQSLRYIESESYLKDKGIEAESYLPQTLYRYGEKDAAYKLILDLSNPAKSRREYPEVSYAVIAAIVTGAMGINPTYDAARHKVVLATLPQLRSDNEMAEVKHLRIFSGTVDVSENGLHHASMRNGTAQPLTWRVIFMGKYTQIVINGNSVRARVERLRDGRLVSWAEMNLDPGRMAKAMAQQGR